MSPRPARSADQFRLAGIASRISISALAPVPAPHRASHGPRRAGSPNARLSRDPRDDRGRSLARRAAHRANAAARVRATARNRRQRELI
eukprot:31422-Pelagococcus_subviridis.AAC.10